MVRFPQGLDVYFFKESSSRIYDVCLIVRLGWDNSDRDGDKSDQVYSLSLSLQDLRNQYYVAMLYRKCVRWQIQQQRR